MCPDYLIYYKNTASNSLNFTDSCVDLLGIGSTYLIPWTTDETKQNPPTAYTKFFPYVYKPGMTEPQLKNLCAMAQQYGLTWEGIYNGESCIATTGVATTNAAGTIATCPGGAPATITAAPSAAATYSNPADAYAAGAPTWTNPNNGDVMKIASASHRCPPGQNYC